MRFFGGDLYSCCDFLGPEILKTLRFFVCIQQETYYADF